MPGRGNRTLTDADHPAIVAAYDDGKAGVTQRQLADRYGVSVPMICHVVHRKPDA